ncbi:MAG: DNA adenine methylase [Melioribacteraceae bacterium]|nr:DNA adenine methylase [Melioribacteraceae bacterium]MCF8263599.1 DNA adenine methylase [Melioribacteraceae bacterium]
MKLGKDFKNDEFMNEIEEAMTYALSKVQAFSGNGGWAYHITSKRIKGGSWLPFLKRLSLINARLKTVMIECLDFEKLIKKYDRESTLFYVDPPYVDTEFYYNTKSEKYFVKEDHERLAELLRNVEGRFILSYYDHPLIRKLYKGYKFSTKERVKHAAGITINSSKERPKAVEVLIRNY